MTKMLVLVKGSKKIVSCELNFCGWRYGVLDIWKQSVWNMSSKISKFENRWVRFLEKHEGIQQYEGLNYMFQ